MSRLQELEAAVSPRVIEDAIEMGELPAKLQIPHALVGGLAVGLNGFPRATNDVEKLFLRYFLRPTFQFPVFIDSPRSFSSAAQLEYVVGRANAAE